MKYFLVIILLFLYQFGFSQSQKLTEEELTSETKALDIENGLSQNTVNALLEDKDGFLWIGTDDGLNRYDGQTVVVYKHIRSDTTTIPDNQIQSLYQDKQGRVWIGTVAGLALYDNNTNQFISFRNNKNNNSSLVNNTVQAITEDKEGFLWIGTRQGLSKFDTKNNTFTNYSATQNDSLLLGGNDIKSLAIDANNNLWIGTYKKGVNKWSADRKQQTLYRYNQADSSSLSGYTANDILIDKDNQVWIATEKGLNKYNSKTDDFQHFSYNGLFYNLQSITQTQNGNLYGISTDYIYTLTPSDQKLTRFKTNFGSIGTTASIIETQENTIWVATLNLGVVYFNPSKTNFQLYTKEKNNPNSLPNTNVWGITKTKDNILWVGTEAGITRIERQPNGQPDEYTNIFKGNNKNDFKINSVTSLYGTKNKSIWVMGNFTISRLIDFSEKEGAKFVSLESSITDTTTLQSTSLAVIEDKKENLWIATFNGIYKLEPTTENDFGYKTKRFLKTLIIWSVYEDKEGILWLGTNDGLVKTKRDEQNNIIGTTFYTYDSQDLKSISSNVIRTIAEDSQGNLWLGTTNGLNKMDKETQTFEYWGERNELANNAIYAILVDKKDNLWISTNRGIFKFLNDKESQNLADDRRIIVYDTRDNLQSLEFNSGAYFKADDGELFFGGINGFNSFYPKDIKPNPAKRKVILTELKLFGNTVKVNQEYNNRILLSKALKNTNKLDLTYEDKIITLEFVSPNFNKPEYDTYLYKLEGFDKDWNKTKSVRQATYTNLPAGDYTFKVKVINSDNIESKETILKISVLPPFWKTWWFIMLCGVVVLSTAIGFYKHKLNSIQAQNTKLESLVNERTSQLKEKNEEVNNRNEEINQQNEEILQQNQELEKQQKLVEIAYQNVSLLSEVGKQITSHLSVEMIVEMVYSSVNRLLDASIFAIGIYNEKENSLDFINSKENGTTLFIHKTSLNEENLPTYCFKQNKEINIKDLQKEFNEYIPNQKISAIEGEIPESLIYVPINYKNETIGVLTVQSFEKNSYTQNHLNLVQNIAVYAAIALVNAKSYEQITEQSKAISIQNENIKSSINYASRIQRAMLPPIEEIKNTFDSAFVLWLPRNVVSGDFYWFAKTENKICIAAIDCTGHGVPGAFMSMIGNDMLNNIILEKKILNPSLVLSTLHQQVSTALRQSETQNRDGMDMSLCIYDTKTKELAFAGAKSPLYYVQDEELKDIAGSKFPIAGKWGVEKERVYKNHILKIEKETTIFLCTDGYQDQFGGDKGKKLMKKKMKSLFVEIAKLDDTKQKEKLENYFLDWKKDEEQVDDVLVMGFKIG
ncbi:two-component regulator propeller domain-containing protein [Bernardetia sp. MNP-M8]|uniref:two-component regulator propeller domain-containing protein n=1 Tax=Bernardetia sp. MNP-M8 TaxID=3127470 RepID=UPI0030D259B3